MTRKELEIYLSNLSGIKATFEDLVYNKKLAFKLAAYSDRPKGI